LYNLSRSEALAWMLTRAEVRMDIEKKEKEGKGTIED
jgi:hypothetical protein